VKLWNAAKVFLFAVQIAAVIFLSAKLIAAEQFRIDNEITADKIVVQSKTYFLENDFLGIIEDNGEITYYNAAQDSFTLLAPLLRIQTRVSASETKRAVDADLNSIRTTKNETDERYKFIANPVFKTELDNKSGQIALQSNWVDYKLTTEIFADDNIAKKYFDSCNLTCYLNYRITTAYGQLLRLEVNRILRNENRFPKNISVTFYYPKGKKDGKTGQTLNSSHKIIKRLTDEDKNKINNVLNSMNTFRTVKFDEYQKTINKQIILKPTNTQ
jgi:hypothetical protein